MSTFICWVYNTKQFNQRVLFTHSTENLLQNTCGRKHVRLLPDEVSVVSGELWQQRGFMTWARCVIRTRQHMNFDQSELDAGLSSAYKRSTCFKLQVTVHFFQNNQDDNCNISNINQGPQNIHHVLDASSRYLYIYIYLICKALYILYISGHYSAGQKICSVLILLLNFQLIVIVIILILKS